MDEPQWHIRAWSASGAEGVLDEQRSHVVMIGEVSTDQVSSDESFIGGRPKLPAGRAVPRCGLCEAQQTFFFQVAFPRGHEWAGRSMGVFACTACAHEDRLIPEMLPGRLAGADIPEGFLENSQINFKVLTFQTGAGVPWDDYLPRVAFRRLQLVASCDASLAVHKIGGQPDWLLDDEAPASYASRLPMVFLMQLRPGLRFDVVPGAPAQIELALNGSPAPARRPYYQLFLGNAVYFFGTVAVTDEQLVYVLTQID